ncbi:MAG: M10 family metallopeptidase C-terminal domain-containing protein, partial [Dongiaceae bacterium]
MATQNDSVPGSGYGSPYLDSLIWGAKWDGGPINYYFGDPGVIPGTNGGVSSPWLESEKDAFRTAVQLYENFVDLEFQEAGSFESSDITWWRVDSVFLDGDLGAHEVPDETFENPIYGYFNADDSTWQNSLDQGGFGFITIIHELGHGLGLAHPHDGGLEPGATRFPGVGGPFTLGSFGLNQGIWTTMTYNDGWNLVPATADQFGWQGTPMALDIAALQRLYGANMAFNTGDQTYELPDSNGLGTFWSCVWDAGGMDQISAGNIDAACTINLNDAPLAGPNAGGFVSWVSGIIGGFTIANNVVIENAAGGKGNDTLTGNEADNLLSGGAGNDSLIGDAGGDTLDGGLGIDKMAGGAGDDTYIVDDSKDVVTELAGAGSGIDRVQSSASFVLGANVENLELTGTLVIDGTGNTLANALTGNGKANSLSGLAGNDTLSGGAGNDTLSGGAGNDSLAGGADADLLDGGAGVDTMQGGAGNDIYVVDNAKDVVDETGGSGTDTVRSTISILAVLAGIENIELLGSGSLNAIAGAGINRLVGNAGANKLDGGGGVDTMEGGKGNDTYLVDVSGDVVTEVAGGGTDTVLSEASYTLADPNVENLTLLTGAGAIDGTGNDLKNKLTGNESANTLDGGKGVDTLIGGKGDDTYIADETKDVVTEAANAGTDTVQSSASYILGANVENLLLTGSSAIDGTGNTLANALTGNGQANKLSGLAGDDTLTGNGGSDTLDGGTGADSMAGGEGDDLYIQDNPGDVVTETGASAGDELRTNQSTLTSPLTGIEHYTFTGSKAVSFSANGAGNRITATAAADSLAGGGGDDTLSGLGGNDTLIGGADDDLLDGGAGADSMEGGAGNDIYVVDNAKDVVDETGGGTDTVRSTISINLMTLAGIENIELLGSGSLNAIAGAGINRLVGNAGANKLDGGGGVDTMEGGKGNDTYLVDVSGDVVTEVAGGGTDTVLSEASYTLADPNVENLTLLTGAGAIDGTGNDLKNKLTGNESANTLDGGKGVDTLIGGKGDDTYIADETKDVVTEAANAGTDTVQSSASYILGANVENLLLTGSSAIDGTGNTLANALTGNGQANKLSGLAGDDTLTGNGGSDTLDGGTG